MTMNKLSKAFIISEIKNKKANGRSLKKEPLSLIEWIDRKYEGITRHAKEKLSQELDFTRRGFINWIINQDNLMEVFSYWYLSEFERDYFPALGRKNKEKFWAFDNMFIGFYKDILDKSTRDPYVKERGKVNNIKKEKIAVFLLDEFNNPIEFYSSMQEAKKPNKHYSKIKSNSQMTKVIKEGGDHHVQNNRFRKVMDVEKGKKGVWA